MENRNDDLEIIIDDSGKSLDISPVYEHLHVAKPKPKENKKKIIIPKIDEKK